MTKKEIKKTQKEFGNTTTFKEALSYLKYNTGTILECVDIADTYDQIEYLINNNYISDPSEYQSMLNKGFVDKYPSGIIIWVI